MQTGIIFDADGTLLDSTAMWIQAGSHYLKTLGIEAHPSLGEVMFSMTLSDSAVYLKQRYPITQTPEEIIVGIHAGIHSFYREKVTSKPGVAAFLEQLHQKGIPMTLATATDRPLIEDGLRHCGLLHYFQGIFTCEEVGLGKDQPDIYLAACACMGTSVSKSWVFEDALHGARTAKAAGFRVAAVCDPISRHHAEELRALADIYLLDLYNTELFFQVSKL